MLKQLKCYNKFAQEAGGGGWKKRDPGDEVASFPGSLQRDPGNEVSSFSLLSFLISSFFILFSLFSFSFFLVVFQYFKILCSKRKRRI